MPRSALARLLWQLAELMRRWSAALDRLLAPLPRPDPALADLAARFPGAPDHWLRLIAERATHLAHPASEPEPPGPPPAALVLPEAAGRRPAAPAAAVDRMTRPGPRPIFAPPQAAAPATTQPAPAPPRRPGRPVFAPPSAAARPAPGTPAPSPGAAPENHALRHLDGAAPTAAAAARAGTDEISPMPPRPVPAEPPPSRPWVASGKAMRQAGDPLPVAAAARPDNPAWPARPVPTPPIVAPGEAIRGRPGPPADAGPGAPARAGGAAPRSLAEGDRQPVAASWPSLPAALPPETAVPVPAPRMARLRQLQDQGQWNA